ncbi:MAG: heavy-metal-associated domain-containing protein [Eisenbergiella massiliensis]
MRTLPEMCRKPLQPWKVQEANVDLEAKKATVKLSADVADDILKKAVEDAGYTAVDCVTR